MKTKRLLRVAMLAAAVLTGAAGFYSCSQDEGEAPDEGSRVAVQFTTQVAGADVAIQKAAFRAADGSETRAFSLPLPQTRTTAGGTEWAEDDKVGIFMLTTGGTLPTNIVDGETSGANNRQYTATPTSGASATLSPAAGQEISYPETGNVDFIAYYPWREAPEGTPYIYKVNVATQSTANDQSKVDVLYSNNMTDKAPSASTPVNLTFNHALSKIVINVKRGAGMDSADFSTMSASLVGFPTTADLALSDGTTFSNYGGTTTAIAPLKCTTASGEQIVATYEAIVIPQPTGITGRTAVFTVQGAAYTWTIPNSITFVQGKTHTYGITVGLSGITVNTPVISDWAETSGIPESGTAKVFAVKIPAGTFLMGSSDGSASATGSAGAPNFTPAEPNRDSNETQHSVTLTKDFYMSKYAITNAQYAAFLNAKGVGTSYLKHPYLNATFTCAVCTWGDNDGRPLVYDGSTNPEFPGDNWGVNWDADASKWKPATGYENHPVIWVTWYGAFEFARWAGGALPTEAQWEYACRGGLTNKPFGVGDGTKLVGALANFYIYNPYDLAKDPPGEYDDAAGTGYVGSTTAVDRYSPNAWGLCNMHGNVWEWCSDWYDDYGIPAVDNPTGPATSPDGARVLRGGSWNSGGQYCRSAYRSRSYPDDANNGVGFRVVFPL